MILLVFILGGVVGYRYAKGQLPFMDLVQEKVLPNFKLVHTLQPQEYQEVDFQTFWEVWRLLEDQYYDQSKVDARKMVDGAIKGLASGLEDPYTVYLTPEEKQRTAEDLQGSFFGIGVQLGYIDSTLAVIAPIKGSPAEQVGVKAGDLILHVKDENKKLDEDTMGWSLDEAVTYIRGKKNTSLTMTLYRKDNGAEPFDVEVTRQEIVVPSVELSYVEQNGKRVAVIVLSSFNERTDDEWDKATADIQSQAGSINGVILDLRNNSGGLLDTSVNVASDFIGSGLIVTQKGRYINHPFNSTGTGRLEQFPVEVLVNRGSASASEIVAGAIRDRRQAKLIGEKTFGKGTVQDRMMLTNGGALHVTIAQWLLPSGEWIHHEGIPVNVEVKDNPDTEEDEALLRAITEL